MKQDAFNGITMDGKPLKNQISKIAEYEEVQAVDPEVKAEFRKNHHLYKSPGNLRFPEKQQKGGKVEFKKLEVNKLNAVNSIESAICTNDPRKAIVAVILSQTEDYISLNDIFDFVVKVAKEKDLFERMHFNQFSLRNHIGRILKTEFAEYIDIIPKVPGRSTMYKLLPELRNEFTLSEALKLIADTSPVVQYNSKKIKESCPKAWSKRDKEVPQKEETPAPPEPEEKRTELASFSLPGKDGTEINVNIFGKIQIEFSIK